MLVNFFYIIRTLTTNTEGWRHMPAVISVPKPTVLIFPYGFFNGPDSLSPFPLFLSLLQPGPVWSGPL